MSGHGVRDQRVPILCLMGPTAVGKTALAVTMAQRWGYEIISVDSAMVYRGMDIGTGKPDPGVLRRAPHRLVDVRDPSQAYSAADFARDARAAITDIVRSGRTPLLVGGTGLYFRALIHGLSPLPQRDPVIRDDIARRARTVGWSGLHAELARVDPSSARRIHPHDGQRIQRALEVWRLARTPLSALQVRDGSPGDRGEEDHGRWRFVQVVVAPRDRAWLHRTIERRFRNMLRDGLVEEVRRLVERGDLDPGLPAVRAVGYRQVWDYLHGRFDHREMVERALAATRQLARRQLTWLRAQSGVALWWFAPLDGGWAAQDSAIIHRLAVNSACPRSAGATGL